MKRAETSSNPKLLNRTPQDSSALRPSGPSYQWGLRALALTVLRGVEDELGVWCSRVEPRNGTSSV